MTRTRLLADAALAQLALAAGSTHLLAQRLHEPPHAAHLNDQPAPALTMPGTRIK